MINASIQYDICFLFRCSVSIKLEISYGQMLQKLNDAFPELLQFCWLSGFGA